MSRVSKHNYYLDIAQTVSGRATCLRRRFGSIIVKNDVIIATGYNGAPRQRKNCTDLCSCIREKLNIPRGERYELCRSVHSEANAIISASRESMLGATLYMCCTDPKTGEIVGNICSCSMCKRLIINAGIAEVVCREDAEHYKIYKVSDWIDNDESIDGTLGY
jgi:dCMP deaminase